MDALSLEIEKILKNASVSSGKDFFKSLTENIGEIIDSDYIFIGKIDTERHGVETLGLWGKSGHMDDFYYDLEDTPCKNVSVDSICCYPENVTSLFPKDALLIQMDIVGYIGSPLKNSRDEVFALIVALFTKPIIEEEHIRLLFNFFSGRLSAELEREQREGQLLELNESLEKRVQDRTKELEEKNFALEQALIEVDKTRAILVENEKLASLGTLVAGVAHEVNTPLGVALTASTGLYDNVKEIHSKYDAGILTKTDMQSYFNTAGEALNIMERNLKRSATIINNFKKISADQNSGETRDIDIKEYIDEVILSFHPVIKKTQITFTNVLPAGIVLHVDVGVIYQIFSNLIQNIIQNAYDKNEEGWAEVSGSFDEHNLIIIFRNGGRAVAPEIRETIFDPFVTSRRAEGGTGLGLHIAYNLVTSKLQGQLALTESDSPVAFTITIPKDFHG